MSIVALFEEVVLLEQQSLISSIYEVAEDEGWTVNESLDAEEVLEALEGLLSEDLSEDGRLKLEALGKALRHAVHRGARIAGRVAGGIDRARRGVKHAKLKMRVKKNKFQKSIAMRKAKMRKGIDKAKRAARAGFQQGRRGAMTSAQRRQRAKAAQASARKRKGKKVSTRRLARA